MRADHVALADAAQDAVGDRPQQGIADRMAERVVHLLEAVEVQAENRAVFTPPGIRHRRIHALAQHGPVRQVGQRVVPGHVRQLRFGIVLGGDILGHAAHADDLAGRVALGPALHAQPAYGAAGPDDAELDVVAVALGALQRAVDRRGDGGDIVRVHRIGRGARGRQRAFLLLVQRLVAGRQMQHVGRQVPVPGAHADGRDGADEARLAFRQCGLGGAAVVHVVDGADPFRGLALLRLVDRRAADPHPAPGAGGQDAEFGVDGPFRIGDRDPVRQHRRLVLRMDDRKPAAVAQRRIGQPGQGMPARGFQDGAVGAGLPGDDRARLGERAVAPFADRQLAHRLLLGGDVGADADRAAIRRRAFGDQQPAPVRQQPLHRRVVAAMPARSSRMKRLQVVPGLRVLPAPGALAHDVAKVAPGTMKGALIA